MIPDTYVWLTWSLALLGGWGVLFLFFRRLRKAMLWGSLFTTPFGLTEPLFVPEYWSPPSLFDLALRTGFDIESLIFCFAIGGVAAVLFEVLSRKRKERVPDEERHDEHHRFHLWALASPFIVFPLFYALPWNPIYPSIVSMAVGAVATVICRPDLKEATLLGGFLFLAYYWAFLAALETMSLGYVQRVWNVDALSGWAVLGFPLEELLFAGTFGMYWAGVYEHFTWHHSARVDGATSHG